MAWTALELIKVLQDAVNVAGKDVPVVSWFDKQREIEVSTDIDAKGVLTVVIEALIEDGQEN